MEPAVRPDVSSQPTAGAAFGLGYVVLFPSPQGRPHFRGVLVPGGAASTLPGLWYCFGWALTKGALDGGVSAGDHWGEAWKISKFGQASVRDLGGRPG